MNKFDYDTIIGIDIGLSGGVTIFDVSEYEHESLGALILRDMPTYPVINKTGKTKTALDIVALLHLMEIPKCRNESALVIFEDVHAFPGQGVVAVGTLLEQKGIIRGMAKALGYGELPISPQTWQKSFGIVCPKEIKKKEHRKKWLKEKSLEVARKKFPDWEMRLSKPTAHGLSDALLISTWFLENSPID